jgi:hypothetical protein
MKAFIYVIAKEKSNWVKSGPLGGHRIEPLLTIYLPRNVVLRTSITCLEK